MQNKHNSKAKTMKKRGLADHQKGLICAFFLTLLPFVMAYGKLMPQPLNAAGICVAAIIQILLQLHYFLGVGGTHKAQWNLISLIFTVLIMTIFIGGTLWVMYTINYRMM